VPPFLHGLEVQLFFSRSILSPLGLWLMFWQKSPWNPLMHLHFPDSWHFPLFWQGGVHFSELKIDT